MVAEAPKKDAHNHAGGGGDMGGMGGMPGMGMM
jgi:hypothetical protein